MEISNVEMLEGQVKLDCGKTASDTQLLHAKYCVDWSIWQWKLF